MQPWNPNTKAIESVTGPLAAQVELARASALTEGLRPNGALTLSREAAAGTPETYLLYEQPLSVTGRRSYLRRAALAVQPFLHELRVEVPESETDVLGTLKRVELLLGSRSIEIPGKRVSQVLEGQIAFDMVLRYGDEVRRDLEAVRNTLISTPLGPKVPLQALADLQDDRGPNYVGREAVQRRIVVSCNVAERSLVDVVNDVRRQVTQSVQFQARSRLVAAPFTLFGTFMITAATLP